MNTEKSINISETKKVTKDAEVGEKALSTFAKEPISSEEALKRSKAFVNRYQTDLALFSGDSSIRFKYAEGADTFSFGMPGCVVTFPVDWMKEEKYKDRELEFVTMHELSHFIDMRDDPNGYMANFERMEKKAKKLARERLQKHPEDTKKGDLARIYFEQLHTLYNCLDDVYVNSIITSKVPYFGRGDGQDSVVSLYEKLGFDERDLTDSPLHLQMALSLLGDNMIGEKLGMSKVDPRVEEILSKPRLGKSLRTWTKTELKTKNGQRTKASNRYEIIKRYFENDYLKLVEEWIDKLPELPPPEEEGDGQSEQNSQGGQGGQGKQGGQNGQGEQGGQGGQGKQGGQGGQGKQGRPLLPGKPGNGPMDPRTLPKIDDIKKTIKEILEEEKNEKKSQAEKDKEAEDKKLKEKGLKDEEIDEIDEILDLIDDPRREMQKFWRSLIGKSIEYRKVLAYNQRRGDPSPESIIDNYADYISAQQTGNFDSAEIYENYEFEKVETNQPERIEVSLLVDCSGSMYYNRRDYDYGDEYKEKDAGWIAKQAEALLLYSLDDFNRELKVARGAGEIDSRLEADTQVILYDDEYKVVKDFKKNGASEDEKFALARTVTTSWGGGGTDDDKPLGWIQRGISSSDIEKMSSKKLKKIVFEITDGATNNPTKSRTIVENLSEDGVLMIGFYIGNSDRERDQFNSVWNADDSDTTIKGIDIKNDLSQLPAKLMEQLAGALGDIVI